MAHLRLFRHYIHTPHLIMALVEGVVLFGAAYLGFWTSYLEWPATFGKYFVPAALFAITLVFSMVAMGVYESRVREGWLGMMLRTLVSIFLLGGMLIAISSYVYPPIAIGRGALFFSVLEGFIGITMLRWLASTLIDESALKTDVIVLGSGKQANIVATRMRRRSDQRGFNLRGFISMPGEKDQITGHGARVYQLDSSLKKFCQLHNVDEVVVALDDRRGGALPLDELLDCRLSGINVCELQAFIEREANKLDVDLLNPSWLVFSDGFITGSWRSFNKRAFDIAASIGLLFTTWPLATIACLSVWIESGFKGPVITSQQRVGYDGVLFTLRKIRSMNADAEEDGRPQWAELNDPRITRVGKVLRKSRIDELPQLLNVLKGEMSFVGPRPERPEFVTQLCNDIPFYDHRHRIKPGITGWAQLCYPYAASASDAKEKLNFDLYYLKNHSLMLDLAILLQTVEVVLVGEGVR